MAVGFEQILIQTVNGIVNGMILALVASGLTLIFGIMDVVNFAHGDLVMLGGFVGAVTIASTGNFWLALLVAAVVIAVFGAVLQATTLRPLIGRDPLQTILAPFGVSPFTDFVAGSGGTSMVNIRRNLPSVSNTCTRRLERSPP